MVRARVLLCVVAILTLAPFFQGGSMDFVSAAPIAAHSVVDTDPYSLISQVNSLRASRGLPGYSVNPILMAVSQQHAQYMSTYGVSHFGADGSAPWQRGLAAGYPLAGDLSRGGFYSENIIAGENKSVQDAILSWQNDAPHLATMLSPNLTEIGAGVVVVGNYVYYVIDCAQPTTGRVPQLATPLSFKTTPVGDVAQSAVQEVRTLSPSTPMADGKVFHIVKPGETLWLIAISYHVKIVDIRKLNNLPEMQDLYPGEKLFIKLSDINPTTVPTRTPTLLPTRVPAKTRIAEPSRTSEMRPTPTSAHIVADSTNSNVFVLGIIVLAALIFALVFVKSSGRRDD